MNITLPSEKKGQGGYIRAGVFNNPIALGKAKIVCNFGLSECKRVKAGAFVYYEPHTPCDSTDMTTHTCKSGIINKMACAKNKYSNKPGNLQRLNRFYF